MNIEVISNSNCKSLFLKDVQPLSPIWKGFSLSLRMYKNNGEKVRIKILPWCSTASYFSTVKVVKTVTRNDKKGYLIYGGDCGLKLPSLKKGLPIIWIDEEKKMILPKKVRMFFDCFQALQASNIDEKLNNLTLINEKYRETKINLLSA